MCQIPNIMHIHDIVKINIVEFEIVVPALLKLTPLPPPPLPPPPRSIRCHK